jgi:uncharacterized surface protein with fasciclin (FAS1) repeats
MTKIRTAGVAGLAALAVALVAAPAQGQGMSMKEKAHARAAGSMNIVEVAASAGTFNTLLTAAKAAGLAETLATGGPFTVFAPTDEAFAALPKGTLEALLNNPEKLKAVLLYHVVSGTVTAKDVAGLTSAKTLEGGMLRINTTKGVMINDATVVKADIMASNGVIHVINKVLIPGS